MTDMSPHYQLARATPDNELFEQLRKAWLEDVRAFDEVEDYANPYIEHAERIISDRFSNYGIYILHNNQGKYVGLLHANTARLPKTTGVTLRVNWILLGPRYDFEEVTGEEFAQVSASILFGAVRLAQGQSSEMKADHIKIHLINLGDKQFARGVAYTLLEHGSASQVAVRGNWLHLDHIRPQGGGR